ncbi:GntR family transcriptional regulator, partial [Shigella sonnei]|uniref:GntR family transcriptional regulator n=2 Tax=Enterobacterales TaxID=91347 RepID=UPI0011E99EFB
MIYKSIAERLRIRLNSADFTLNSLLPGEKKLAEEFAVSRMTIRKAIDLLVAWGLVEVLKRQGKTVTSQVLIFEIMPAPPAIASQLRIQINEQIYF